MKPEEIRALISYRLQRSDESLKAAEIMLRNKMLTSDYMDFSEPDDEMITTYLEGARNFIAILGKYIRKEQPQETVFQ